MDYLCIVDISEDNYKITIYGYGKKRFLKLRLMNLLKNIIKFIDVGKKGPEM